VVRRILKQRCQFKTVLQQAELQEKRASLFLRIQKWWDAQDLYMPAIRELRAAESDHVKPESLLLYLPSAIPADIGISGALLEKEE